MNTRKPEEEETYPVGFGRDIRFNDHICVEGLIGVPDEKRTGRIVQIRRGIGAFGSDLFLVRLRDRSLASFHNVMIRMADDKAFEDAYYVSNGHTPPAIPAQPPHTSDSTAAEYTIGGEWPETGFIIGRPKQPHSPQQSFGMTVSRP